MMILDGRPTTSFRIIFESNSCVHCKQGQSFMRPGFFRQNMWFMTLSVDPSFFSSHMPLLPSSLGFVRPEMAKLYRMKASVSLFQASFIILKRMQRWIWNNVLKMIRCVECDNEFCWKSGIAGTFKLKGLKEGTSVPICLLFTFVCIFCAC